MILALAHFTGWSLAEFEEMDIDELLAWCETMKKFHN